MEQAITKVHPYRALRKVPVKTSEIDTFKTCACCNQTKRHKFHKYNDSGPKFIDEFGKTWRGNTCGRCYYDRSLKRNFN